MWGLLFASVFMACHAGKVQQQSDNCEHGFNCTRRQRNLTGCPAGFYCPSGNHSPVPCPEGTFRSTERSPPHQCVACPINFFNAKVGQVACFPCGSEAVQPKEGQNTCVCLREGRVFQPSDAQCPCGPGYHSPSEDRRWDCVEQVYDICRDAAVRNQDGQCLTKEEQASYCREKICSLPEDYRGYDKVLGLCLCQAESLDGICNLSCRRRQKRILQLVCGQEPAQLSLTYRNGSQVNLFLEDLAGNLRMLDFHTQTDCTSEENGVSHPIYVVKTNGSGFLGVYDPDPEFLHDVLTSNGILPASQNVWHPPASSGTPDQEASRFSHPPLQPPTNPPLETTLTGILNPTMCLNIHNAIMFMVSKDHYPVYDVNHLYNTNREFDWGGFRSLAEEAQLATNSSHVLLFCYQFHALGSYILRLSSNPHKRMYIRVMPYGGTCYEEGPFFPTTPRHVVRVGLARIPDLILKPDWQAILGIIIGLLCLLLISLLLVILCPAVSPCSKGGPNPRFRKWQLQYNFDQYSSRESRLVSVRKYHPGGQEEGSPENNHSHLEKREGKCERWDSKEQIDLDSFNTNIFFEILVTQSLAVTAKLGQFKEELKTFYHKLLGEIASLRDLWVAKVCVSDTTELYDDILMASYIKVKQQAEDEILRRRYVAAEYEEHVSRQLHLLNQELKCQNEHFIVFHSALREAKRLVEVLFNALSSGEDPKPDHHRLLSQIETITNQMSSAVIKESHRLMLWGILGEGIGAHLVNQEKNRLFAKEELVGPDGFMKAHELLHRDATTGLVMPNEEAVMLLANQSMKHVSTGHFVHPGTGKLLPILGNVGFNTISSEVVPMVDLVSGEVRHLDLPIFPYVPFPVCPSTGLPTKTNLPVLQPEKVFKLGGLMHDPASGIEVPILAITVHPQTGQKLSLGGTYLNPLTGMVTPLEIGAPMRVPEGGRLVPILGVSLDRNTGDVLPVGGSQDLSGNLLLVGDSFMEPLSGKTVRVQGACLREDKVVPQAGGYQVALEAHLLVAEIQVAKALKEYKEAICEDLCHAGDGQRAFKEAEEDMMKAMAQKLDYLIYCLHNLEKQKERASNIKCTGGKLGMIKYPSTELWIPAVFGMKIPDPGGSNLMVPILGVECDWKTGQPVPLAGTMEDADGKGLIPLALGSKTMDPITGEAGPVIGAEINPWTTAVVPVVQSLGSLPRGNPDPDLLAALEKERVAKQSYWQGQREKEEEMFKELDTLGLALLDAAGKGKMKKLRYRDKLKPAEQLCRFLEEGASQEVWRRASRDSERLWGSEPSLQMRVEKDEEEQDARVRLLLRKALERWAQFVQRVQLEEGRIQMQMKEAERQWNRSLLPQEAIQEKSQKARLHLVAEIQGHLAKQQADLESSYSRLEYLRLLSERVALQTKELLSGSTQCFVNYPGARFYGVAGAPQGSWAVITQKLIPLLKCVVQSLEETKKGAPEMLLGLGSGEGYSSRSTLKVSEAPSEVLRTNMKQEMGPITGALSPVPPSQSPPDKSQLLQEIQTRIFLERHTSEMVGLEWSLMAEEIDLISCFCESMELKKSLGSPLHLSMDSSKDWEDLLDQLVDHHRHLEEELVQRQWEEMQYVGLALGDAPFKVGLLFSREEIRQNLRLLGAIWKKADSLFRVEPAKESNGMQTLEATSSLVTQKIQATANTMVQHEAAKQLWVHKVLDHYCSLYQNQTFPDEVLQATRDVCMGANVARDVVRSAEKVQVERAVAFLQKCTEAGELPLSFSASGDAEGRKLQALIQTELQAQIEEKIEARVMEAVQEAARPATKLSVGPMTYFLLSWWHLQQAMLLEADLLLQKTGLRTPRDGSNSETLALDEPLVDEDTKALVWLLEEQKQFPGVALKLQQAAQMLQLRKRQFQEMVQNLQARSPDKGLEDANQMAKELQAFQQQKTRELMEQLHQLFLLGDKEPEKDPLANAGQAASARSLLEKEEKGRKGKWESFQEAQLAEMEKCYWGLILEEKAKLQDQLEKGEIKTWLKQELLREHDETVTFLERAFQQDLQKRRGRAEEEKKRRQTYHEDGSLPMAKDAPLHGQNQPALATSDQVSSLLAEYVKMLKHIELMVLLRTTLLNPQFRSLISGQEETDTGTPSHILTLLNDVNEQLQRYAAAAGFLDHQHPEQDAVNSFQDIMDLQVTPKSGELVPVPASNLSPKEFVIYQYGIVVLQFLQTHIGGPEVCLDIASSIPSCNAPGNAFRNTFYYKVPERKLFVLRECLSCIGSFVLLLVHCLAHIAANDLGSDSSPAFQRLFYQALKACLGEMFSLRLQMSAVMKETKSAARMINEVFLKKEQHQGTQCDTEIADFPKKRWSPRKQDSYSNFIPDGSQEIVPPKSSASESCPPTRSGAAEGDGLDTLTEKWVKVLEKEQQVLKGSGGGDQLFGSGQNDCLREGSSAQQKARRPE